MDKAINMGKTTATGSFQLFIGKVLSSIILAVGSIILGRVMAPAEYGIYAIALIPSMTLTIFRDWGISRATIKFISQYKNLNADENINDIIITGSTFKVILSMLLSLISLFFASFIATTIFNRPETTSLISIASLVILFESLIGISQSIFSGYERMEYISYTLICQAILKSTAAPLFILLGYGALGAVTGYVFSFIGTALLGIILLYFRIFNHLKRSILHFSYKLETLKYMLKYGFPISISEILCNFLYQFYAFLMAFYVADSMIGNYQIAVNFGVFTSFFSYPLVTVLFPAFSKLDPKNEIELLRSVFSSAVKYAALFLVPATMATIILSGPVIETIYGQKWTEAPFFLSLYALQNFFVLLGGFVVDSFLKSVGETKILLRLSILRLIIGIILALVLIPVFGIVGVILGTFFAELLNKFLSTFWLNKQYAAKPNYRCSFKIFSASLIGALITTFILNLLVISSWLKLIIGASLFIILYIILLPLFGAITKNDIQKLKAMFSDLGVFTRILDIPFTITEIICSILKK